MTDGSRFTIGDLKAGNGGLMKARNAEFWLMRAQTRKGPLSPGSPCAEDLKPYNRYAELLRRSQAASGKSGLLLGFTPLITDWCRENALRVTVMDFCEPLVLNLKARYPDWDGLEIIVDDWLSPARADHSFCWAAGDGIINAAGSGSNSVGLLLQIKRLLLPGSIVILRNLLRPFPTPSTAEVFAGLSAGRIRSRNALQHQVSQSLQPSFAEGVSTRETYKAILKNGGLQAEEAASIEYYREGGPLCYPTMAELRDIMDPDFEELDISCGDYEMAELSPTIVYRARATRDPK